MEPLPTACSGSGGFIGLLTPDGTTIVADVSTSSTKPTTYGGIYMLRASCQTTTATAGPCCSTPPCSKRLCIEASRRATAAGAALLDPLTNQAQDWKDLFQGLPTPCAEYLSGGPAPGSAKVRQVSCNTKYITNTGGTDVFGCTAACDPDEMVSGGGEQWSAAVTAGGRYAYPVANGYSCATGISSCTNAPTGTLGINGNGCSSQCFALCMKGGGGGSGGSSVLASGSLYLNPAPPNSDAVWVPVSSTFQVDRPSILVASASVSFWPAGVASSGGILVDGSQCAWDSFTPVYPPSPTSLEVSPSCVYPLSTGSHTVSVNVVKIVPNTVVQYVLGNYVVISK